MKWELNEFEKEFIKFVEKMFALDEYIFWTNK